MSRVETSLDQRERASTRSSEQEAGSLPPLVDGRGADSEYAQDTAMAASTGQMVGESTMEAAAGSGRTSSEGGGRTGARDATATPSLQGDLSRPGTLLARAMYGTRFWRNRPFNRESGSNESGVSAGMRAVERAVNGAGLPHHAAVGRSVADSINLDASERGTPEQILFYHKPSLANVPAGDVPDALPVYLGCPGGGMALGLPLSEAWQGHGQQDTTFNQNLSYTILSWPEDHVKDLLELWRSQVVFLTTMMFSIAVTALLFFAEYPDRTRVEAAKRDGAFPEPFQRRSTSDYATGFRSQEWHVGAALVIMLVGMLSVMSRVRAGIALYLCLTVANAIVGLSHAPDALYACRFAMDLVLVAMGRSFLSKLTYSWVTASAGDGRRPW